MKPARPPGLLVLAVLGLHLLLGREVLRIHDGWLDDLSPPVPPRMQVAFVQELAMQAPAARVAAPPAAAHRATGRQQTAGAPERAASEPPRGPAPAAVTEERVDVTPSVVAAAASAPPQDPVPQPGNPASAVASDEPGPEWPLSTRLTYLLTGHYRGPLNGSAQVEWLRQGRDYQVHLDVDLGLISRRMSSQGVLTSAGIAPQRYDEETKLVLMDARRAHVRFLGPDVQLAHGAREPVPPGAQDSASQFVQLTWLFLTGREPLQAGHAVRFPLVLPRRQYAWQYDVVGEETLETPMGPIATWHLRPARAVAGGDLLAEVWLAPSLQYLPVRILIRQDAETHLDLVLKRAPLQAAPESPDPRIPRRLSQ